MKKFSIILAVALLTGLNVNAQGLAQALPQADAKLANVDEVAAAKAPSSLEEKFALKKAAVHAKMMAKKAELGVKPETDAAYNDKIDDAVAVVKESATVVADPANAKITAAKEVVIEDKDKIAEDVNDKKAAIAENIAQTVETADEAKDAVVEDVKEVGNNVANAVEEVQENAVNAINEAESEPTAEVIEVVSETEDNIGETKAEAVEAIAEVGNDLANTADENKEEIAEAINEVKEDVQQTQSDLDSLEEMLGE